MILRGMTVSQITQAIARSAAAGGPLRCVSDHRRLSAGDVWFAVPGQRFDPRTEMQAAGLAGVLAVVAEATDFPAQVQAAADALSCPVYLVEGLAAHAGPMAADLLFADSPLPRLVAVTGTNGKTSVTRWVAQALSHLNERCAVVGTLGAGFIDGAFEQTGLTTPDAVSLHNSIATLGRAGARAVALEASSIGLDQGRLNGCRFSVAAFTNLSRDHLDYHGSMEAYEAAKQLLFSWPALHRAVINLDDPAAPRFRAVAEAAGVSVIGVTAAAGGSLSASADVLALSGRHAAGGVAVELRFNGESAACEVPVVGQFNLENLAVVAGVLVACGHALDAIARALAGITPPPGRMQMLSKPGRPLVVVDYAHTPDALEKVLQALRPVADARGGRLACLFGCGGDRDPGKRPLMGAVAERLSDVLFVTSDNPRSENPQAIIEAIVRGIQSPEAVRVDVDRARAIQAAIAGAAASDVVLLAGKGHETGQIMGAEVLPFSDADQAEVALSAFNNPTGEGA